jgi:asparagine synthase (glutamine-hydrolysing)
VAAPLVAALSKRARGTITVALTGDGGDEVFAGYASHLAAYHAHEAGSHPVAYGAAIRALRTASALKVPGRSKFAKAARLLQQSPLAAAAELRAVANATEREALLQPRALRALAESGLIEATSPRGEAAGSLEGLFHPAFDPTLADLFLHKADVASMSASLECRTPFLDRALVDYVARLPLRHLVLGPLGKRIPRALVAKRFGARLGYRPKAGFSPPLDAWLRGPLSGLVRERLLRRDSALFDWVRPEVVTARAEAHLQGRADERRLLWTLLVLEAFLAGRAVRGAAP